MKGLCDFVNKVLKKGVHYVTADYKTRNPNYKTHNGIDIVSHNGKNTTLDYIVAIDKGVVSKVGFSSTGGYYVNIKHDNGFETRYQHLKKDTTTVKVGDKVKKGQTIAYMGNTGSASKGAHLHFGVMNKSGTWVDPLNYLMDFTDYKKGNYITLQEMNIRTGAGSDFTIKKVKDLTKDGQKNSTSDKLDDDAKYKKGTIFTALEIIINNGVWAKTPSGYICIVGSGGKIFCEVAPRKEEQPEEEKTLEEEVKEVIEKPIEETIKDTIITENEFDEIMESDILKTDKNIFIILLEKLIELITNIFKK